MSLFGSLKTFPLNQLLSVLKDQEGALELWNLEGLPPTTIYLKPGRIRHIVQGGSPLDPLKAKAVLYSLLSAEKGSFEFIPGAKPKFKERLAWPLDRVLLSITTLQDELSHYRPYLPRPEVPFRLVPGASLAGLEKRLKGFLERALPYLKKGASSGELSQKLGIPLDLVRYYLHKLHGAGLLERADFGRPTTPSLRAKTLGAE